MNRISQIKRQYDVELGLACRKNNVSFTSIQNLLDAEKTKKLLKRTALIQTTIDKEIDNALSNENR